MIRRIETPDTRETTGHEADVSGCLFVVATPIGNLEDITLRALRVLKEVDLIAAEDTRVTAKLLHHYQIPTRMVAWHAHSSSRKLQQLVTQLQGGAQIALVTDAGTPAISDPGANLVSAALSAGIRVVPIPGVSAPTTLLSVAGQPHPQFVFLGFLPRKPIDRRRLFTPLRHVPYPCLFFESPERLPETLRGLQEILGDRTAVVGRELTKRFEAVVRGQLSELIERFQAGTVRGEVVVLIEPDDSSASDENAELAVEAAVRRHLAVGSSVRDAAAAAAAECDVGRSRAYAIAQRLSEGVDSPHDYPAPP